MFVSFKTVPLKRKSGSEVRKIKYVVNDLRDRAPGCGGIRTPVVMASGLEGIRALRHQSRVRLVVNLRVSCLGILEMGGDNSR